MGLFLCPVRRQHLIWRDFGLTTLRDRWWTPQSWDMAPLPFPNRQNLVKASNPAVADLNQASSEWDGVDLCREIVVRNGPNRELRCRPRWQLKCRRERPAHLPSRVFETSLFIAPFGVVAVENYTRLSTQIAKLCFSTSKIQNCCQYFCRMWKCSDAPWSLCRLNSSFYDIGEKVATSFANEDNAPRFVGMISTRQIS